MTVAGALGTTIGAGKVTYAKIQNETNNTILEMYPAELQLLPKLHRHSLRLY